MLPPGDYACRCVQAGARTRPDDHCPRSNAPQSGAGGQRSRTRGLTRATLKNGDPTMKLKKQIVLLPGDGIGPEVTRAAASVLQECAREFQHQFEMIELPIGGAAIDKTGGPLPNETLDACRKADAVFLLAVGKRPETGLLGLRKGLGLYVNLRPVKVLEPLRSISPLRPERLGDLDI